MKNRLIALAVVASAATVWAASVLPAKAPPAPVVPVLPTVVKAPELTKAQTDFFEAKVRPLLAANCYKCHSIETGKAKGGLILDTREGVLKGGDNGAVIVPGDAAKSRLITAIHYEDPDLQMPPKGEKLSEADIVSLTTWVQMGAPDPRTSGPAAGKLTGLTDKARAHWAYQPVKEPAVPAVKDNRWVQTPVDAFIEAKLEKNGLQHSAPATKEVLIRRATYDLIGLPPTPEEVQAFVSDASPNAYEKVLDRLLASPHYGERWGRFWLDSARYSDTTGQENAAKKGEDYRLVHAWTYRDYVINAFNGDKPYDQFLKEQIAADLLPGTDKHSETLAALGFLTIGKRFANPNDTIDERIDTLGKATQGLTVACARCHDHKFDPIPTADYYSLHGIFASTFEPAEKPVVGAAPSDAEYADYQKKLAALEQQNRDIYFDLVKEKGDEFRKSAAGYLLTSLAARKFTAEDQIARNKLIAEFGLSRELYQQFRITPRESSVFGPLLKFDSLPADQFSEKAKEVLAEIATGKVMISLPGGGGGKFAPGKLAGKPGAPGMNAARPGGREFARTINPIIIAAFKDVTPESLKGIRDVTAVYGKLFVSLEPKARAFIEANRKATSQQVDGFDPSLVELLQIPAVVHPAPGLDSEHLKEAIAELPQQNGRAYRGFKFAEIGQLALTHPGAPSVAMVVADSPNPHNSPVFIRGEAQNRGPIVPRQFLQILSGPNRQPFTVGSGRLELANAIGSKNNPLTARVMVNRIWLHHFGEGFVRTPDDMGVQSEPPSHPELLDYLSSKFMTSGWSVKQMHRIIMLSSTYQQSSENNAKYTEKDPDNHLLWRANLRRLDFEAVRDTMLQLTGKLEPTIGGKPVNLTEEPYSNRRSVYGYIDRGNLPELMAQFDFSDPDMANSRRTSTIVPQQALFFMNSPMSVDVVRKLTSRAEFKDAADDAARVRAIYEVIYQREPRAEEVQFAVDYVAAEKEAGPAIGRQGQDAPMAGRKFKPTPGKKGYGSDRAAIRNEGAYVERKPLTPWELYAQALLFTNELAYVN